jgi:hypothetical protein
LPELRAWPPEAPWLMLGLEIAPDFVLAPWASSGGLNPNARAATAVVAKIVVPNLISFLQSWIFQIVNSSQPAMFRTKIFLFDGTNAWVNRHLSSDLGCGYSGTIVAWSDLTVD